MSTTTQPRKPKCRWYQFSLKTLLIAITVATVAFGGWVQYRRQRARANRARVTASEKATQNAIAEIEDLGGEVTSAYDERRAQTWLETQFDDPGSGDDPVRDLKVRSINFGDFPLSRAGRPRVYDAGLIHLTGLTDLETLWLTNTNVTDAGLEHLKGLTNLQDLCLCDTNVTDAGLIHLEKLTNLSSLNLSGTNVTDAGLMHLKALTHLQVLMLAGCTQVTDAGLEHLNDLTNLAFLIIGDVYDDDAINVTDAGLEHLRGLTNLRILMLVGTNVTDKGVKRLQQALPKCRIAH